jgi:DNA-directed RNA polymerase specialized sigma subunit
MSILKKNKQQQEMNQQEVADVLGITRTAVQQTEKRAMRKIARFLEERKLKKEDLL